MKKRYLNIVLALIALATFWLPACKPKQICPAYQSAFYLDKKTADIEFSPFDKDSMPKLEELVRKTDVLLVIRLGKKKIDKRLATIPMITIFPELADSALAMADSLAADSAAVEEEGEGESEEMGDSTEVPEEGVAPEETGEEKEEVPADEPPKEAFEDDYQAPSEKAPKPKTPQKKTDPKDPEVSDPGLKAEFEESFDDAPKEDEEALDMPSFEEGAPPPPSEKKKKEPKKGSKKAEPAKKEEPEPEPEEDKF